MTAANPRWARPALIGVLLLAAFLYLFQLNHNGYGNDYYAAAALAGAQSWKALFFGALDAPAFITVDKPPVALWLMGISVKVFGLSSWSLLVPEALAGVASVALLYDAVRRTSGHAAGLVAAFVLATTPVATLMFRFDNPDALLTLLLVAGAWAVVRALESGRLRWLLVAAVATGFAFNTKSLQAYIALPAFTVVVLLAYPGSLLRRIGHLSLTAAVVLLASGWWGTVVMAIPAALRPYIGGSTNNSEWNLVFGYNGLGRIFGNARPGGGAAPAGQTSGFGGGGPNFGGPAGWLRLFNDQLGGQISWLIPLAIVLLVGGLVVTLRRRRTDLGRAGLILWGTWFLVHAAVFSFASGIFHPYYTVAMAPSIAALVGIGAVELWNARGWWWRPVLAVGLAASAWWAVQLLERTPSFVPWLSPAVLVGGVAGAVLLALPSLQSLRRPLLRRLPAAGLVLAVAAVLAGPVAYSLVTVTSAASGGTPAAGPATSAAATGGFGPGAGAPPGTGRLVASAQPAPGAPPFGLPPDADGARTVGPGRGQGGGLSTPVEQYLVAHQGSASWILAVSGAQTAAQVELATGKPVLAMGGFSGSDPAPTLSQLKALVKSGQLRYVMVGDGMGGSSDVSTWVAANGTPLTVNGTATQIYDLTSAAA